MKTDACEICNPPELYQELAIKAFQYWRIGLHVNQYFLGRCVVLLNRHVEDFFDITSDELEEFYTVTKSLRDALRESFNPQLFNYATLGNEVRHVHFHVISRYENRVMFDDVTFTDERWGKNYAPYNKDFVISHETLMKIKAKIQASL